MRSHPTLFTMPLVSVSVRPLLLPLLVTQTWSSKTNNSQQQGPLSQRCQQESCFSPMRVLGRGKWPMILVQFTILPHWTHFARNRNASDTLLNPTRLTAFG